MKIDNRTPTDFVWRHRGILGLSAIGIPLLLEGGSLVAQTVKNPEGVKKKIITANKFFINSFIRKEGEETKEFCQRLIKNVILVSGVVALAGGAIATSFIALPYTMAIGLTISTIFLLANLYLNSESISAKVGEIKKSFTERITPQKGETEGAAKKRILKNILRITVYTIIALGVLAVMAFVASQVASGAVSIWSTYTLLPSQTPAVVFCEYAAVGAAHGALAIHHARKGRKGAALFHLLNGFMGFFIPSLMLHGYPAEVPRLHHSFLGLALALLPFRPLQIVGSAMTLDSLGSTFFFQHSQARWDQYDFMNILVKEKPETFTNAIAASSLQDLSSRLPEKSQAR